MQAISNLPSYINFFILSFYVIPNAHCNLVVSRIGTLLVPEVPTLHARLSQKHTWDSYLGHIRCCIFLESMGHQDHFDMHISKCPKMVKSKQENAQPKFLFLNCHETFPKDVCFLCAKSGC